MHTHTRTWLNLLIFNIFPFPIWNSSYLPVCAEILVHQVNFLSCTMHIIRIKIHCNIKISQRSKDLWDIYYILIIIYVYQCLLNLEEIWTKEKISSESFNYHLIKPCNQIINFNNNCAECSIWSEMQAMNRMLKQYTTLFSLLFLFYKI